MHFDAAHLDELARYCRQRYPNDRYLAALTDAMQSMVAKVDALPVVERERILHEAALLADRQIPRWPQPNQRELWHAYPTGY